MVGFGREGAGIKKMMRKGEHHRDIVQRLATISCHSVCWGLRCVYPYETSQNNVVNEF